MLQSGRGIEKVGVAPKISTPPPLPSFKTCLRPCLSHRLGVDPSVQARGQELGSTRQIAGDRESILGSDGQTGMVRRSAVLYSGCYYRKKEYHFYQAIPHLLF